MKKILTLAILHLMIFPFSANAEKLNLSSCLKAASENNPSLKVVAYNESIADDEIGIAGSTYLPRVDMQSAYTVQNEAQSIKVGPMGLDMQEPRYASGSVSMTQVLYDFGRTDSRKKRAEALKDAAAFGYKSKEQDLFIKVVESYYGILESEKVLKAADQEIIQMEQHLKIAKTLYEQGVATKNDVLQADVQLANSRQRRLSVVNRHENRWLQMNFLTGSDSGRRGELEEDPMRPGKTVSDPADADFSKHSEIMAMKSMIEADRRSVEESRAHYKPEVFGRLQADYLQNKEVEEQGILSASVGMKVNLFDGYATTSRTSQALKNLLKHEEALRELQKRLRLEYQTAVNDSKVADKRIDAISRAIAQGEENLRINVNKYKEQAGTATNVLDAQTLLTNTRTEYYRALFDKEIALARIKKATGNL
ncbi:TolC family protein [Desulforegula conservatrix]|uniref:TolC family protein n=1 Tax=Desulforegula conservatrix TaxID=153026 RepID=UPI0004260C4C|nr:TolC family protein [Desulforegula conservatrix]